MGEALQWLGTLAVFIAIAAIFLTMPAGQQLANTLGMRRFLKGRAPDEDRDYLLRVCDGDPARVESMLAQARRRNPEMTEAEAYRRAIRAHMRDGT